MASQKREKRPRAPRETRDLKGLTGDERKAAMQHNFRHIAKRRVPAVLRAIKGVSALANRGSYHYSPEQVLKILTTLQDAVAGVKAAFSSTQETGSNAFDI